MHRIISYIKFLLKSKNHHGVHSPFVFNLVTKCFYDKTNYPAYTIIGKYRQKLLQDKSSIKVTDYGAGSRVFSSEERKISAIAKNAGITSKRARLLNRLVQYLKVENALELGTSLGISTAAISAGNSVKITTIEGCPETAAVARTQFADFGLENVELKVGEFDKVLDEILVESGEWGAKSGQWKVGNKKGAEIEFQGTKNKNKETGQQGLEASPQPETRNQQLTIHFPSAEVLEDKETHPQPTTDNAQFTTRKYSLLYFDGNHQKEPTLRYFEKLLPTAHNDSVFIFDDIHWSKEMEEAWEEIKNHPAVTATIDTFYQGFVFFRKEQAKEHFVIRV